MSSIEFGRGGFGIGVQIGKHLNYDVNDWEGWEGWGGWWWFGWGWLDCLRPLAALLPSPWDPLLISPWEGRGMARGRGDTLLWEGVLRWIGGEGV